MSINKDTKTLNEILSYLESFSLRHSQIEDYSYGDIPDPENTRYLEYPAIWTYLDDAVVQSNDRNGFSQVRLNFELLIMDEVDQNDTMIQEVQSDALTIANDLIAEFAYNRFYQDQWIVLPDDINITPFRGELASRVSGQRVQLPISMNFSNCYALDPIDDIPEYSARTITAKAQTIQQSICQIVEDCGLSFNKDITFEQDVHVQGDLEVKGAIKGDGSQLSGISTTSSFSGLTDTNLSGVTDGQVAIYNDNTNKWEPGDIKTETSYSGLTDIGEVQLTGITNTFTADLSANNIFNITLSGDTVLDYTNEYEGGHYYFIINQDGTNPDLTLSSDKWMTTNGDNISISGSEKTLISAVYDGDADVMLVETTQNLQQINALLAAANAGSLFLWTQGGRENLVSDGAVELESSNDDHLEHPDDPDFEPGSENFHIGGWHYISSKGSDMGSMAKWDASSSNTEFILLFSDSPDRMRFGVEDSSGNVAIFNADNFGSPPTNTWFFVDAKWDGTTLYLRVNDGNPDTTSFSTSVNTTSSAFRLGNYINTEGSNRSWSGRFDSCFFYKGGTLTDQEITFLYNSGNGRTYAEVSQHPTLGTKFDGTSGYWWNLDEVSGTRFDATGGGKDLTPVNSPSLAQGVVAGQPSTEQAALSKWEDDSGKSHDPVQSTSTNKGFTWIDTDGKMYVEFGGDDYFEVPLTVNEINTNLGRNDSFICCVVDPDVVTGNQMLFGILDTGGQRSEYRFALSDNRISLRYMSGPLSSGERQFTSSATFSSKVLLSGVVRMNGNFEIWSNDTQITTFDINIDNGPDYQNFDVSNLSRGPFLGARNRDDSVIEYFQGKMFETVLCNDLSRFDNIRKELLQKHNL